MNRMYLTFKLLRPLCYRSKVQIKYHAALAYEIFRNIVLMHRLDHRTFYIPPKHSKAYNRRLQYLCLDHNYYFKCSREHVIRLLLSVMQTNCNSVGSTFCRYKEYLPRVSFIKSNSQLRSSTFSITCHPQA